MQEDEAGLAGAQSFIREPLGARLRLLSVGPAERPSSSPRPDIGEVYADGVLLVWKPVESYGPVTYIVQCSLEGMGPLLNPHILGGPGVAVGGPWGSTWLLCTPGWPAWASPP